MGKELVGFETVEAPMAAKAKENGSSLHHNQIENKKAEEIIKFGSHGDENAKVEAANETKNASQTPSPKDIVNDWPSSKQVYFIKYRSYDDSTLKAKIDQGEKEFQKVIQARYRIIDQQRAIKSEKIKVFEELKILNEQHRKKQSELDQKRREIAPLQMVFTQLRTGGAKGDTPLCSSEEELDDLIYSLNYRIQHDSIPLAEEKKILREVKQLEQTREKVIANAEMRAKIQNDIGEDKSIHSHYKAMGGDLTGARREHQKVRDRIEQQEKKKKIFETELKSLQEEFEAITEVKDKGYKNLQQLRLLRDEENAVFYQNRSILNRARNIAVNRDVKAVEELARVETEKFMSQWSSDKAFRNDYEKRILVSLDNRQLSRDGRIRNTDEKPLVAVEVKVIPSKPEPLVKANEKQAKEEEKKKPTKIDSQPIKKAKEEGKKKLTVENVPSMEEEEIIYKPPKKEKEVDVEKLKEIRRQEEIAKAKQAMERKKKRAEKAAAIAAIIAQKEAEKKPKEREKKEKKKAAASTINSNPEEQAEAAPEVVEAENAEMVVEAPVPEKNVEKKKNPLRQRTKTKAPDPLPRVILKRKKATNYWLWAAPAALTLILPLALGYIYLQ